MIILPERRDAMSDSVMECYADKKTEPVFVKGRMMEARKTVKQKLLGIFENRSFMSMLRN